MSDIKKQIIHTAAWIPLTLIAALLETKRYLELTDRLDQFVVSDIFYKDGTLFDASLMDYRLTVLGFCMLIFEIVMCIWRANNE